MSNNLGFKALTAENWMERDPATASFSRFSPEQNGFVSMTGEDWLQAIMEPTLSGEAPVEVHRLFETARGALVYGVLFYPLYTLGLEQLLRVADAATYFKCQELGAPPTLRYFSPQIDFLVAKGLITKSEKELWEALRQLRNETSHPKDQMIIVPGQALRLLGTVCEAVNRLYPMPVSEEGT